MKTKEPFFIFYSWASDNPNSTNRGFIEDALDKAIKNIKSESDEMEIDPVIDRDVQGLGGAPDISKAILDKIDRASVFVADVSIINQNSKERKTPNPNVLFELGYAFKKLGAEKLIFVMNTEFGGPESLPFDLKMRTTVTYKVSVNTSDKSQEKAILQKKLESQIKEILRSVKKSELSEKEILKNLLSDPQASIKLDDFISVHLQKYIDDINIEKFPTTNIDTNTPTPETIADRIDKYDSFITDFGELVAILTKWIKKEQYHLLEDIFRKTSETHRSSSDSNFRAWLSLAWYPTLKLIYYVGLSSVINNRYDILNLLSKIQIYGDIYNPDKKVNLIFHICLSVSEYDSFKMLVGQERKYTPRSDHLFTTLKQPIMEQFLISEKEFERCFDKFEILLALMGAYGSGKNWGLIGKFGWKRGEPFTKLVDEARGEGEAWQPLQGGLFGGSSDKFQKLASDFSAFMSESSRGW